MIGWGWVKGLVEGAIQGFINWRYNPIRMARRLGKVEAENVQLEDEREADDAAAAGRAEREQQHADWLQDTNEDR